MTETIAKTERQIPDLWEISMLPELKGYSLGGKKAGDLIRETWHCAHDLRKDAAAAKEALQNIIDHWDEHSDERKISQIKEVIEEIL